MVNDKELFNEFKSYLKNISPEQVKILHLYAGNKPIFDAYSITRQVKSSFGKTATMNSGAYLVIEKTEAMHRGRRHQRIDLLPLLGRRMIDRNEQRIE